MEGCQLSSMRRPHLPLAAAIAAGPPRPAWLPGSAARVLRIGLRLCVTASKRGRAGQAVQGAGRRAGPQRAAQAAAARGLTPSGSSAPQLPEPDANAAGPSGPARRPPAAGRPQRQPGRPTAWPDELSIAVRPAGRAGQALRPSQQPPKSGGRSAGNAQRAGRWMCLHCLCCCPTEYNTDAHRGTSYISCSS